VSIEDDLETDVASLRRELLAWILTELRSGAARESLAGAPLAKDLVEVVRGGLQGAVDQAIRRVEDARVDGVVEALNPSFGELYQELRGLQASLRASIAAELTDRTADADARFASLERSLVEVQRALGERRATAPRGADRTDEILLELRRLGARPEPQAPAGPERRPSAAQPSATPQPSAPRAPTWSSVAAIAAGAAVVAGLAGWFVHGARPAPLIPESDVAGQAQQLQSALGDIAAAPAGGAAAPKVDPQTVAGDLADVAAAVERAADATTPDDLRKAHQDANDAMSQLRGVLAFAAPAKPAPPTGEGAAPSPSPSPPSPRATHFNAAPVPRRATAASHPPASPPPSPPPAGGAPAGTAPASPGGGA
jgi:hypothetical protein